jgi:DNA-directed RNA polymerase alpha subunit
MVLRSSAAAATARPRSGARSRSETRPIGRLQLDASFSPIRRVSYSVDARASNSAPTSTS